MADLVRELEQARRRADLTKTDLARAADMEPAAVRRLLSGNGRNPTMSTLDDLASAMGYELRLVPRPRTEVDAESNKELADAIVELLAVEGSPFKTVLADPPWRFINRTGKVAPEHKRLSRYDTMTVAEISKLPVGDVTAANAHLYLWVPNALIADGLEVMKAWGFSYKSNLVWAKRRKDGGPDGRGVGFYFRNTTELVLFGVKGSLRTLKPGRRQVNIIETRKREHSRKPDEVYEIVEACSPGPYLELFARYPREGWSAFGNEAGPEITPRGKQHSTYRGGEIQAGQQRLDVEGVGDD
jgi:N6-adenosine-specific RNA methylase IME4